MASKRMRPTKSIREVRPKPASKKLHRAVDTSVEEARPVKSKLYRAGFDASAEEKRRHDAGLRPAALLMAMGYPATTKGTR